MSAGALSRTLLCSPNTLVASATIVPGVPSGSPTTRCITPAKRLKL